MAWIITLDGTNDYLDLGSDVVASTDCYIEIKFRVETTAGETFLRLVSDTSSGGTGDRVIVETNGDRVIVNSGGSTSATWSSVFGSAISDGQIITIRVETTGTAAKRLYVDGVDKGTASTNFTSLGRWRYFGVNFGSYSNISYYYIDFTDNLDSGNSHYWSADDSSHGTGTPVLVDTLNSMDATGVNMATDGSVWTDLGGGGTVYTLVTQSSSQLQSSQNADLSTGSVLGVGSSSQIQISGVSGLLSKSALFLNDSSQSQISANVANSAGALLAASNSYQAQISQDAQLAANSFITPQLSSQAQQSDSSQLFVAGVLSVQNTVSGQYSQNVTLQIAVPQITVQASSQLSVSSDVTLTSRSALSVSGSGQTQLSENVFFAGNIYYLDAKILMYTDLNANLSMYPAVTATMRIN